MSDYPPTSPLPPSVVNDFPSGSSIYPPPPPVVNDFPSDSSVYPSSAPVVNDFSRAPATEDVVDHRPPPSYGFLNPSALNNTNNVAQKASQYQPQWGTAGNMTSTPNLYGVPRMINPEINNIENYKVWSILNIFFCCLCLGFVACYYSSETDNMKLRGDIQGALNASRNARTMNIVATILGIIIITANVLIQVGLI